MADDRPEDTAPSPDSRPRRAPPTIELEATDVSTEGAKAEEPAAAAETAATEAAPEPAGGEPAARSSNVRGSAKTTCSRTLTAICQALLG